MDSKELKKILIEVGIIDERILTEYRKLYKVFIDLGDFPEIKNACKSYMQNYKSIIALRLLTAIDE